MSVRVVRLGQDQISVALAGYSRQPVTVIDPAIESHYGTGYERTRLFPGGTPSLEFVRSMELLDRLLPRRPHGCWMSAAARAPTPHRWPGAATRCTWWIRCRCTWSRPARQRAATRPPPSPPPLGDARELPEPDRVAGRGAAVRAAVPPDRRRRTARQALAEARRVLRPGGRLLVMAVCRFASLLDGLYEGWLDDPVFVPIVDQDLLTGSTATPIRPAGRSSSPPRTSTLRTAWRRRSGRRVSPARPSTGSRVRAGRCARNGPTHGGASRSCSPRGRSRPSPH